MKPIIHFTAFALLAIVALGGCVQAQMSGPEDWQSPLYKEHELVGRIWDSQSQKFISADALWSDLESARYLLLGEKHDNPDHHNLQLTILNDLIESVRVSQITMEMLDSTKEARLSGFLNAQFASANSMKRFLAWDDEGWDWEFYGPLLQAAHGASVPVLAGNISPETMRGVYAAESSTEYEGILDEPTMARLLIDIDESHCGLLPESQFPAMVRVQQARDLSLAANLVSDSGIALLIAGNYHIRHDLGVPNYLLSNDSTLARSDIVSLALLEVAEGETDPRSYLDQFGAQAPYDFIWFTPALTNEDYCDSLR